MNTFQQWQNKEISDIECIRGLNNQNRELMEDLGYIILCLPNNLWNYRIDEIKEKLKHHTSEEEWK